jgi:hypothetical protein
MKIHNPSAWSGHRWGDARVCPPVQRGLPTDLLKTPATTEPPTARLTTDQRAPPRLLRPGGFISNASRLFTELPGKLVRLSKKSASGR